MVSVTKTDKNENFKHHYSKYNDERNVDDDNQVIHKNCHSTGITIIVHDKVITPTTSNNTSVPKK